jgi:hypothetical protein
MTEIVSFSEWLKRTPIKPGKDKPAPKNKSIDAFVKAVDNLKKDLTQLDAIEKKEKPEKEKEKPKPEDKDKIQGFQKYKDKRDAEQSKDKTDTKSDKLDVSNDVSDDSDDKRLRLSPDKQISVRPKILRKESPRLPDLRSRQLEGR